MDGHAEALIDLAAVARNVEAMREHVGGTPVMAVVKADGYGHGMIPSARAAVAGGAQWLGVVHEHEALALRQAGITTRVLSLLGAPGGAARGRDPRRRQPDRGRGAAAAGDRGGGHPGRAPGARAPQDRHRDGAGRRHPG